MERAIVGSRQHHNRVWLAELSCGHDRLVHQLDPSALSKAAGGAEVGAQLDCPSCDRAELPKGLRLVRSTPKWDEHTIPPALRRSSEIPLERMGQPDEIGAAVRCAGGDPAGDLPATTIVVDDGLPRCRKVR